MKKAKREETILTCYEKWELKDKHYEHFRLFVWVSLIIFVCTIFLICINIIK
ncbi:MAG: hypothetical protein ACLS90_07045 [Clostridia bacterium]